MQKSKKVVLISFYDKISISMRVLSTIIKDAHHEAFLFYVKDDRTVTIEKFSKTNNYYQFIRHNDFIGCGPDVNPILEEELQVLVESIQEINPDVIGFSSRSVSMDLCEKIVSYLRPILPSARYIAGGYGPTIEPLKFLKFVDYVCLGEGENSILPLIEEDDPNNIPNAAWIENGRMVNSPLSAGVDLNDSSIPDWDLNNKFLIEDCKSTPIAQVYDQTTYDLFASRGCPANCTYCMAAHWDTMYKKFDARIKKIRLRTPENIINELQEVKNNGNIKFIRFMDSVFGFQRKWFDEFYELYRSKIDIPFFCNLDERFIDEERIQKLQILGLEYTTVGIQSTSEDIRYQIMSRKVKNTDLVQYAEMLKRNGVKIIYDIIGWNPFDTRESLREGIKMLLNMPKGEDTIVYQLKFFPGSPIMERFNKEKPVPLSDNEYEYWAWIYQMILRSEKTAQVALDIDNSESEKYIENPQKLQEIFKGLLASNRVVVARNNIAVGDVITPVMLDMQDVEVDDGINYNDVYKLSGVRSIVPIKGGDCVKWNMVSAPYAPAPKPTK